MRGAERRAAALLGLTAVGLAWMGGLLWSPPGPIYDPVAGTWRVDRVGAPIEMVWYGRVLWAWSAAAVGAALGWALGRRGRAQGPLWEAWCLTALGLAVVLSAVAFWP